MQKIAKQAARLRDILLARQRLAGRRSYGPHSTPSSSRRAAVRTIGAISGGGALLFSLTASTPSSSTITTTTSTPLPLTSCSTSPLSLTSPPNHDLSPSNLSAAHAEFLSLLGPNGIDSTPTSLYTRSNTEWSLSPTDTLATYILFPTSTADVSTILSICHRRRIPVTPFSGGTSLDGALAATRGGIVLDLQHMDNILALHEDDLDVVVQPAVGWEDLNAFLAEKGLFFPPDPGPGAQIGGMISTGCSGTNAYRYGTMKEWVLSMTVVLADGTVVKTRRRARKSTAGYDLARLIVGASGTLGVVTEAALKVTATPKNVRVAVVPFESVGDAVGVVTEVVKKGLQLGAMELLDRNCMRGINYATGKGEKEKEGIEGKERWRECPTLFLKFQGEEEEVAGQVRSVKGILKRKGIEGEGMKFAETKEEGEELWRARKIALFSFLALKNDPMDKMAGADAAVPISRLTGIVEEMDKLLEESGLWGMTIGHVGDGNFHLGVAYPKEKEAVAKGIAKTCRRRAIELEGTVTGEHGVGMLLRDDLEEEVGDGAIDMMRRIKLALDPHCILNCDKVIRMERPDAGDQYRS